MNIDVDKYKKIIRPLLGERRYHHSVCVYEKAVYLARKYSVNEEKAALAGILHDIMKDIKPAEQLKMMTQFDIILSDVERSAQKLWHAILGAAYIENELKITDLDVINAVRYHTTGRANMTMLDKVIFIADFISDDRDFDGVDELRKAAELSLEQAMIEGITYTIKDLANSYKPIHPDTISAYNQDVLKYKLNI